MCPQKLKSSGGVAPHLNRARLLSDLREHLHQFRDPRKAKSYQRFFKTGRGQYGEGDIFIGLMVPDCRKVAVVYRDLSWSQVKQLLSSQYHEERLIAILIMIHQFRAGDGPTQSKIYNHYLKSVRYINNWDLIDLSAPHIPGKYLQSRDRKPLVQLAKTSHLWKKRISIVSTHTFIKAGDFNTTFEVTDILMHDQHDLIHKAVGWMLREVGKVSASAQKKFLKNRYHKMPRTMLRYAIERFPAGERKKYLLGQI